MFVHSWEADPQNWFDPGVGRYYIPLYFVEIPFGESTIYSDILIQHFCLKIYNWISKKKANPYFPILGSVGNGQKTSFWGGPDVVSHGLQLRVFGFLPTTHVETNANKMCPWSLRPVRCFTCLSSCPDRSTYTPEEKGIVAGDMRFVLWLEIRAQLGW